MVISVTITVTVNLNHTAVSKQIVDAACVEIITVAANACDGAEGHRSWR